MQIPLPKSLLGYDVVSHIADGARTKLYVVADPKSGQLYAMKHLVRKDDKDLKYIERIQSEFDVSKGFRSPFLRKCVDLKINKKLLGGPTEAGLVMELVDGDPLEFLPDLPPAELVGVFMQVARGLAWLHHQRFVHADVRPHHILVSPDRQAKLIDFGHVCKAGAIKEAVQRPADFVAPEQVRCKNLTPQTDIYNLGGALYWALTRRRIPTLLSVPEEQWETLKDQPYPSPSELNPAVPEPLSKLAMWCCKFSLGSRPPDMDMVIAGLQKVAEVMGLAPAQAAAVARV